MRAADKNARDAAFHTASTILSLAQGELMMGHITSRCDVMRYRRCAADAGDYYDAAAVKEMIPRHKSRLRQ